MVRVALRAGRGGATLRARQPFRRGRQLPRPQSLLARRRRANERQRFSVIGVDTCRGSGVEGPRAKDYHGAAVSEGSGTFAGTLHRNIINCGFADLVSLIVSDSITSSTFFADRSIDWVHLDARHDRENLTADIAA